MRLRWYRYVLVIVTRDIEALTPLRAFRFRTRSQARRAAAALNKTTFNGLAQTFVDVEEIP